MASLVIDTILSRSSPNTAVAYFYCNYNVPETQNPCTILACLIRQLAKQDEASFLKVQGLYKKHSQGRKQPTDYDPQELCELIIDMARDYESTVIVVDGLDECGPHTDQVTELLTMLYDDQVAVKTLLLSRDEYGIRHRLVNYPAISIAARSSDLRLYVGAEIETRVRKEQLRLKNNELKEVIRNTLVEGAQGM